MKVQLAMLPQGAGGPTAQDLVLAVNDRLRRINTALLAAGGAVGPPGAPGAPGAPGTGAEPTPPFTVPVSGNVATPNASYSINVLIEYADTFVGPPKGVPAGTAPALWSLKIVQGSAGNSTSFDGSYNFTVTATDATSPLGTFTLLTLSTSPAGITSLVSFSTDQPT
jgi:hypothetical protein